MVKIQKIQMAIFILADKKKKFKKIYTVKSGLLSSTEVLFLSL